MTPRTNARMEQQQWMDAIFAKPAASSDVVAKAGAINGEDSATNSADATASPVAAAANVDASTSARAHGASGDTAATHMFSGNEVTDGSDPSVKGSPFPEAVTAEAGLSAAEEAWAAKAEAVAAFEAETVGSEAVVQEGAAEATFEAAAIEEDGASAGIGVSGCEQHQCSCASTTCCSCCTCRCSCPPSVHELQAARVSSSPVPACVQGFAKPLNWDTLHRDVYVLSRPLSCPVPWASLHPASLLLSLPCWCPQHALTLSSLYYLDN